MNQISLWSHRNRFIQCLFKEKVFTKNDLLPSVIHFIQKRGDSWELTGEALDKSNIIGAIIEEYQIGCLEYVYNKPDSLTPEDLFEKLLPIIKVKLKKLRLI